MVDYALLSLFRFFCTFAAEIKRITLYSLGKHNYDFLFEKNNFLNSSMGTNYSHPSSAFACGQVIIVRKIVY